MAGNDEIAARVRKHFDTLHDIVVAIGEGSDLEDASETVTLADLQDALEDILEAAKEEEEEEDT